MAMLTSKTWIVVADSERAMILENSGDTRQPVLRQVAQVSAPEVLNAGARMVDQGRDQRMPVQPPDRVRLAAETMMADLVAKLEKLAAGAAFDQLVLVAPPQVLGAIRDHLPSALKPLVVAEIPKTLTRHPLPKIADLVAETLGAA